MSAMLYQLYLLLALRDVHLKQLDVWLANESHNYCNYSIVSRVYFLFLMNTINLTHILCHLCNMMSISFLINFGVIWTDLILYYWYRLLRNVLLFDVFVYYFYLFTFYKCKFMKYILLCTYILYLCDTNYIIILYYWLLRANTLIYDNVISFSLLKASTWNQDYYYYNNPTISSGVFWTSRSFWEHLVKECTVSASDLLQCIWYN